MTAATLAVVFMWLGSAGWSATAAIASNRTAPLPVSGRAAVLGVAGAYINDGTFTYTWGLTDLARPVVVNGPSGPADNARTCAQFIDPSLIVTNLTGGYSAEKSYYQEKDRFAPLETAGFAPEGSASGAGRFCWKYVVTLTHRQGSPPASDFFLTAQPFRWSDRTPLAGPTLCIASVSGAHASGQPGISMTGAPILSMETCAALPPSTGWRAPLAHGKLQINPLPSSRH